MNVVISTLKLFVILAVFILGVAMLAINSVGFNPSTSSGE